MGTRRCSRPFSVLAANMLLTAPAIAQHADDESAVAPTAATPAAAHDEHAMAAMTEEAPPMARDPHAYAEGETFTANRPMFADMHRFGSLLVDNLELQRVDDRTLAPFHLEAWYGGTYERAVIKAEGMLDGGDLTEARAEIHWSHAFAPFWDRQVGMRIDSGDGPNRAWAAFGVEGIARGWIQIEATFYAGESNRTAGRIDVSRDFRLTQQLVLQPRIEANAYGKADPERAIGAGLADVTAAMRLRYEIRREVAPYIGVEWSRQFGDTRELVSNLGGDPGDTRAVIGIRFWF
jgi:copper resistance protein B